MPCVSKIGERLIHADHAEITQNLGVKAGIEQMQNGMFNAADILINRHPVIQFLAIKTGLGIAIRAAIAVEIPGRFHKRVHRVRLPSGLAAAFRASRIHEFFQGRERRPAFGCLI